MPDVVPPCPRCGSLHVEAAHPAPATMVGLRIQQTLYACIPCRKTWQTVREEPLTTLEAHIAAGYETNGA